MNAIPAAIICQVVFTVVDPLNLYFEYNEPPAQLIAPITKMIIAIIFVECPDEENKDGTLSPNNNITPRKPMINPNTVDRLERFSFHFGQSSNTNHIGAAETMIAANELGNVFSE